MICTVYRKEEGSFDGHPRYVERNKNDGSEFAGRKGAEIKYCEEIGSWVFMHEDILPGDNECSWLWKSHVTEEYDILSTTDGAWEAWIGIEGEVKPLAQVSITCNDCSEQSDCNHHGECRGERCECQSEYFGAHCEFQYGCQYLASEKGNSFGKNRLQFVLLLLSNELPAYLPTYLISINAFFNEQTRQEEFNGSKSILSTTLANMFTIVQ